MNPSNQVLIASQGNRLEMDVKANEGAIHGARRDVMERHGWLLDTIDYMDEQIYEINGGYDASNHVSRARDLIGFLSVELALRCTQMETKWDKVLAECKQIADDFPFDIFDRFTT